MVRTDLTIALGLVIGTMLALMAPLGSKPLALYIVASVFSQATC